MEKSLNILSWDTNFLGYTVGRLCLASGNLEDLKSILKLAKERGIRLLYWSVSPVASQSIQNAQHIGAYLADQKVTYAMNVAQGVEKLPLGVETTLELTSAIKSLALQSGQHSRYRKDISFAPDVYQRLYLSWIENSITGKIAREVLVYKPDLVEIGFLTLGIKNQRVDIGLLSVDEHVRGKSIGGKLIDAAKYRTLEWGYSELQVVTQQNNDGACRFYERCGFQVDFVEYLYHIWL